MDDIHKMLDAVAGRKTGASSGTGTGKGTGKATGAKRGRPPKVPAVGAPDKKTKRKRTSGKAARAAKKTAAGVSKPKVKGIKGDGRPKWSNERTRSQIQCRNPNWAIKYGKDYGVTEAEAIAQANKWLKTAMKKWESGS